MKDNSLVPSNEIQYTTVDGKPIDLSESTMGGPVSNTYNDGKGVAVFEDPIECIEENAFCDCSSLEKVVFSSSDTEVYMSAFRGCVSLKAIYVPKDSVEHLEAITDSKEPYDEDENAEEAECYKLPSYEYEDDEEDEDDQEDVPAI